MKLLLSLAACLPLIVGLIGCSRSGPSGGAAGPEVVLYSSVDDALLRQVVDEFERESGVRVKIVGDTEATKTTGLVERLLAERGNPRADVWWSSEPFGTIRLAREGVLAPYTSPSEEGVEGGWPAALRGDGRLWYGFASRVRVIVYNARKLAATEAPASEEALLAERWRGKVGMARPQFGTTRGHMGFLLHACGEDRFRAWARGLKASGVRLYDGNSQVVRAVAQGEIDVGLTDTDDVYAGQREGWPVAMVYPRAGEGGCPPGPMLAPNTAALVKGAPHPDAAGMLIDFLLSEGAERLLAGSESHNVPVRARIAAEFREFAPPEGTRVPDLEAVERSVGRALQIWDEETGA
jgi:iron(III) transport system substrate-binding protein